MTSRIGCDLVIGVVCRIRDAAFWRESGTLAVGSEPGIARTLPWLEQRLAVTIPTLVLADLIGIHPTTAVKWSALTSGSWSGYIAQRTRN